MNKKLNKTELYDWYIKTAIDNGFELCYDKYSITNKLIIQDSHYDDYEIVGKNGLIHCAGNDILNFIELITSGEFIETIAKYVFDNKIGVTRCLNERHKFPLLITTGDSDVEKQMEYILYKMTIKQAVAIANDNLEDFIQSIYNITNK